MEKPTILKKILQRKQEEVIERKKQRSLSELEKSISAQGELRGFTQALAQQIGRKRPAVIAEIKKPHQAKVYYEKIFSLKLLPKVMPKMVLHAFPY